MGTRGLLAVKINNEYKTAYNHFDSYVEGLGLELAVFIHVAGFDVLKKIFSNIKTINERTIVINKDGSVISEFEEFTKHDQYRDSRCSIGRDAYSYFRNLQMNHLEYLKNPKLDIMVTVDANILNNDFDFCYIIDLDSKLFTIIKYRFYGCEESSYKIKYEFKINESIMDVFCHEFNISDEEREYVLSGTTGLRDLWLENNPLVFYPNFDGSVHQSELCDNNGSFYEIEELFFKEFEVSKFRLSIKKVGEFTIVIGDYMLLDDAKKEAIKHLELSKQQKIIDKLRVDDAILPTKLSHE